MRTYLQLVTDGGYLGVLGGNNNRVAVDYSGIRIDGKPLGWLIDTEDSEKAQEIDLTIGNDVNPELIYRTVTKEKATIITLCYLEGKPFPENTVWDHG